MNDSREIVLFFEDKCDFDVLDVAKDIRGRYPELGNPLILQNNGDPNKALIIFNENPEFQININGFRLSLIVSHVYFKKLPTITFDMVDVFSDIKIEIVRIGLIANIFKSPDKINAFKEKFLVEDEFFDVKDFNVSWYRELKSSVGILNCWERFITNRMDFNDLLIQYDINSPSELTINLNMKYIKKFIEDSEEFIDKRIQF